jgi:hypothetical protein
MFNLVGAGSCTEIEVVGWSISWGLVRFAGGDFWLGFWIVKLVGDRLVLVPVATVEGFLCRIGPICP